MIKSKPAIIMDSLLISIITFILLLSWAHKLLRSLIFSVILVSLLSSLVFIFTYRFFVGKNNISKLSARENKLLGESVKSISAFNKAQFKDYFERLLDAKNISGNIFQNKLSNFYVNFAEKLSSYDYYLATNFYNETDKSLPLVFIGKSATDEFMQLNSGVYRLFSDIDMFEIMKEKSIFPEITQSNSEKVSSIKKFKKYFMKIIASVKFKDFFFTGISLALISVIVPYPLYYLLPATFLLVLAMLSKIVKFEKGTEGNSDKKLTYYTRQKS